jgi:hypothetical protein
MRFERVIEPLLTEGNLNIRSVTDLMGEPQNLSSLLNKAPLSGSTELSGDQVQARHRRDEWLSNAVPAVTGLPRSP